VQCSPGQSGQGRQPHLAPPPLPTPNSLFSPLPAHGKALEAISITQMKSYPLL